MPRKSKKTARSRTRSPEGAASRPRRKQRPAPEATRDPGGPPRQRSKPSSRSQRSSPSYALAFQDPRLLLRDALRPVRLQLEWWKPDLILREHRVRSTVAIFGSARIFDRRESQARLKGAEARLRELPDDTARQQEVAVARRLLERSRYYEEARKLASIISRYGQSNSNAEFVVVTGGGPGIMEAANRGAHDVGAKSIGLNILLPFEQEPNPYITPELCFQFRYFAIRKMHFLIRARALVAFPGGYGTFDEFFDIITLIQTGKAKKIPVILFGREFWRRAVNLEFLRDEGTISPEDLSLFRYADTAETAWKIIADFYGI